MQTIRQFLKTPSFDDYKKDKHARMLNSLLAALAVANLLDFLVSMGDPSMIINAIITTITFIVIFLIKLLLNNGNVKLAAYLGLSFWYMVSTAMAAAGGGPTSIGFLYFVLLIIATLLILNRKWALFVTILCALTGLVITYLYDSGYLLNFYTPQSPYKILMTRLTLFIVAFVLIDLAVRNIYDALNVANVELEMRKQTEAELSANEKMYRGLFENSPVAIWEADISGILDYYQELRNEGVYNLEKYLSEKPEVFSKCIRQLEVINLNNASLLLHNAVTKEDLIKNLEKTFTPNATEVFKQILNAIWNNKLSYQSETILKTMDEEERHVMIKCVVFSPHRETTRMLLNMIDITERKKAETLILDISNQLDTVISSIPIALFAKDKGGRYILINPAFASLTGINPKDIKGKTAYDIWTREDADLYDGKDMDLIRDGGNQVYEHKVTILGKEHDIIVTKACFKDAFGNVAGLVGSITDISYIKKAEEELRHAKEKAEDSDRLKSIFLANMSHEIRTPLNSIVGFTELLCFAPQLPDAMKEQYTHIIKTNSNQLMTIINDIIDIAKIEAGEFTIINEQFNINHLLGQIAEQLSHELEIRERHQLKIELFRDLTDDNALISSDQMRLMQVITNIGTNAIKFTERGIIEIGYVVRETELLFFIKDTGKGIKQDKLTIIFDLFRQEEESLNRKYGGTGLGLTISKAIVERLGGSIWVESEPGIGSSFFFTIPYQPIAVSKKRPDSKPVSIRQFNMKGKTVLIAEDVDHNFRLLADYLKDTDAKILHARDGNEAVSLTQEHSPDIILMDLQMPCMNGLDATREIRKFNASVPVIAQTAFSQTDFKTLALDAGCNDFIAKPIHQEMLLFMMQTLLKK